MSRDEKKIGWEDWNEGEEELNCAKQGGATKTSRAPPADLETPPNSIASKSSTDEESQKWSAKADKAAKHSARMLEVWAKRRAEGTNGRKGRRPLPRTVGGPEKGAE